MIMKLKHFCIKRDNFDVNFLNCNTQTFTIQYFIQKIDKQTLDKKGDAFCRMKMKREGPIRPSSPGFYQFEFLIFFKDR